MPKFESCHHPPNPWGSINCLYKKNKKEREREREEKKFVWLQSWRLRGVHGHVFSTIFTWIEMCALQFLVGYNVQHRLLFIKFCCKYFVILNHIFFIRLFHEDRAKTAIFFVMLVQKANCRYPLVLNFDGILYK